MLGWKKGNKMDQTLPTLSNVSFSHTRLRGRWLFLARATWVVLAGFALIFCVVSLPGYLTHLQTLCTGTVCADKQLAPAAAQALQKVGISIRVYAIFFFVLTLFPVAVWLTVGGVIAWRKSNDWMALLMALALVLQGSTNLTGAYSSGYYALLSLSFPAQILNFFAFLTLLFALALFPGGRFVPRWFVWLTIPFTINMLWYNFISPEQTHLALPGWLNGLSAMLFIGELLGGGATQIYRYRRVSTALQRQQTKWVVFGIAANLVLALVLFLPTLIAPALSQPGSLYNIGLTPLTTLVGLLIPLSIGIAIMRYRLWDIDTIINKTLVYGGLSVLLAAIYTALVVVLEGLIGLISKQASQPIVIVIATLTIAALFQPLRKRLQNSIDRQFYRRKYDAEKTLAAFSATLRDEVDLKQLCEQLLSAVQETMQPAQVSLWLTRSSIQKSTQKPVPLSK